MKPKKQEEFNLSEKRFSDDFNSVAYHEEDVKEFIRLLKEKAKEYEWEGEEIIDKLAGDKLI